MKNRILKLVNRAKKAIFGAVCLAEGLMWQSYLVFAADKKDDFSDVTSGLNSLKTLVTGCVTGVGAIFLLWGVLDFGVAYSSHDTNSQSGAIKKIVGGVIMVAASQIASALISTS